MNKDIESRIKEVVVRHQQGVAIVCYHYHNHKYDDKTVAKAFTEHQAKTTTSIKQLMLDFVMEVVGSDEPPQGIVDASQLSALQLGAIQTIAKQALRNQQRTKAKQILGVGNNE